jgi:hypothetical protein
MSTPELINPNTPLAYIPADLATQYQVSRYVFIATLGVSPTRPFLAPEI